ncbi:MAG: hypothetical protein ABI947_12225 [Chloroflexota bacterium]
MVSLLSIVAIGIGALLVLVGLLMIAPQVRVHKIKIYSAGSWLYRVGMLLVTVGLILLIVTEHSKPLGQIGWIIGVTGIMGGVITAGHEWHQARDAGNVPWDWPRSLTLQLIVIGVVVFILGVVAS